MCPVPNWNPSQNLLTSCWSDHRWEKVAGGGGIGVRGGGVGGGVDRGLFFGDGVVIFLSESSKIAI